MQIVQRVEMSVAKKCVKDVFPETVSVSTCSADEALNGAIK